MEWQGKDKTNEKDILIQIVSDLRAIAQREFRGGYESSTISRDGNVTETYVPDSRREYSQLVDFLCDFLIPDFDEQMANDFDDISKKLEELVTKQNNKEIDDEEFITTKLRLSRKLLQHLFLLLKRINWKGKTKQQAG